MSRFLDFLFSITGLFVCLSVSAVWLARRPRSTTARRVVLIVVAGYGLAMVYFVPVTMSRLLTAGYTPFQSVDLPSDKTAIVLLGGGDDIVFGWHDIIALPNPVEAARVLEAWRVYRLIEPRWVISSGGPQDEPLSSSISMRGLLVQLGVPADRILLETKSRNTFDQGMLIGPMLQSLGVEHIVLVTSAVHIRRAMGAFRAAGLNPIAAMAPAPDHRARWPLWVLPTNHALLLTRQVAHEVVGIPYYWIRGWWK